MPLVLNMESIQHNFNYYISSIVIEFGHGKALMMVSLLVVILALMKTGFKFLANYYITPVRVGVVRDIRNGVYDKTLRLPMSYFSDSRKGDIMARVGMDVNEIELSVMSSLEMIFRDPITIIVFLISMLVMSAHLTLFALILLPVSGLLIGRIGKNLRRQSRMLQSQQGTLLSILEETLSGMRIVKAFNGEKKMTRKFTEINQDYTDSITRVYRRRFLASPMSEFMGTVVLMVLMSL